MSIKAALFDLDGVIVDTAKYHFLAWRRLAQELGFMFTEKDNERLKGVSRMRSLEILLEVGGKANSFSLAEREEMASRKNNWYVEYISKMDESEILPGTLQCLKGFRDLGIHTALGSASKNAMSILDNLNLIRYFDAIIDGNKVSKAKPDPEVFLLGAKELSVEPSECVVFEDAQAGIEAAKAGGMKAVAIGKPSELTGYDRIFSGLLEVHPYELVAQL
ncbi:MAG: beta-phosphoglucomutase, partial [Clostridia bacterium]|nr:beta-phosphoglucomutase [Clostridia bacterium]